MSRKLNVLDESIQSSVAILKTQKLIHVDTFSYYMKGLLSTTPIIGEKTMEQPEWIPLQR